MMTTQVCLEFSFRSVFPPPNAHPVVVQDLTRQTGSRVPRGKLKVVCSDVAFISLPAH